MLKYGMTAFALLLAPVAQANSYYDYVAQQNNIKDNNPSYVRSWNMTTLRNVSQARNLGISVRAVYTRSGKLVGYQLGNAKFYNAYSYSYSSRSSGANPNDCCEYPTHGDD